jgi:hypothetical protein
VAEFRGLDDPAAFWSHLGEQLASGRFRLLFVADHIPTEVQTVIEYLNEQMPNVDVLAVEIKQYTGAGHQALVPRLVGMTGFPQAAAWAPCSVAPTAATTDSCWPRAKEELTTDGGVIGHFENEGDLSVFQAEGVGLSTLPRRRQ